MQQGRALDIRVVGLGRAGGNLAGELHRRGYRAIAFSVATGDRRDASALPAAQQHHIDVVGHDGAGADPELGRACIRAHAESIRATIEQESAGGDLVLIAAGLGGGTGSAIAELVDLLEGLAVPVMALTTLPAQHESALAKVNAVRAVAELADRTLAGWIIADNSGITDPFRNLPVADYWPRVNEAILAPIDGLNRLNGRDELTAVRAFDGEDLRRILLASGVLGYATVELDRLSPESISEAVSRSLDGSELMPSGFDVESLSHLCLVIEASAKTLGEVPMAVIGDVRDQWKRATQGAVVEVGIYRTADAQAPTLLRILATSHALPARIQTLVGEAASEARHVQEKMRSRLPALDIAVLDGVDLGSSAGQIRAPLTPGTAKGRPVPGVPAASNPAQAKVAADAEPLPSVAATASADADRKASRPPPPPPPRGLKNLPSPETYEKLVRDFRGTTDNGVRRQIAQRLEEDRFSEHAVVRYYVVDAMSKLDKSLFETALLAATEDENEAVRKLANLALND